MTNTLESFRALISESHKQMLTPVDLVSRGEVEALQYKLADALGELFTSLEAAERSVDYANSVAEEWRQIGKRATERAEAAERERDAIREQREHWQTLTEERKARVAALEAGLRPFAEFDQRVQKLLAKP